MLSEEAKEYIKNNKILLQEDNFQEFFDECKWYLKCEIAEFLLLDCDINFLEYMTEITDFLFYSSKRLKSIVISNSIIALGEESFRDCKSLQSINIPNSVIKISNIAFGWCESLQSINIQNSVTYIGDYAFCSCKSLQSIDIPESVINIGKGVFEECALLKEIKLPKHLKEKIRKISSIGINKNQTKIIWY